MVTFRLDSIEIPSGFRQKSVRVLLRLQTHVQVVLSNIPWSFVKETFLVKSVKESGKSMEIPWKIHGSYGFSMDPGFPFLHVPSMLGPN